MGIARRKLSQITSETEGTIATKALLVWVLPIVVLLLGIGIVIFKARRLTDNRELTTDNAYINRVRELVEKE